ncbi:MAG: FliO/MopB family protein [Deltaproteobacteria bacterium]|nr:FliO/MopB family protein [Deltaproteobacteria bacterium]
MEMFWAFLQITAMLAAVVLLAYLVLHKGLGKLLARHQTTQSMAVKERLSLEPRRSLYLVDIKGRNFVLAGSENGVSVVCELDEKPSS